MPVRRFHADTYFKSTPQSPDVAAPSPPDSPQSPRLADPGSPTGAGPTGADGGSPSCTHCSGPAVEYVRYAGVHLCRTHFLGFVEKRVKRTVREQGGVPGGARIGIAVSGGKDSIVALRLMHRILLPRLRHPSGGNGSEEGDVELVVLTADEGIRGYREEGIEVARKTAKDLGLEHHVSAYEDTIGPTMDQVHKVKGNQNECSYCGVFRRTTLNELARGTDCDLLVTGHNLDDTAQAVLMNLTTGDPSRLTRLGPHSEPKDGLVPRRLPLRWIPERETALTAILEGWRVDTRECPYSVNAQRGLYRDILMKLEREQPGTRHSLLRTLDALKPALGTLDAAKQSAVGACRVCNGPASGEVCQTCRLGQGVRDRIARMATG